MSAYEIAEITASNMSNFLTTFSVFLSVATAYLVAAFLVGKKLSSLQLTIVNGSYLISAAILGYLVSANFRVFYIWASSDPKGLVANSTIKPFLVDFTWPLTLLLVVIVIGSLTFMFSVRNRESDEPGT